MSYESLAINFDTSLFYEKRARDYADAALSDGGLPETAPNVGISDAGMSPKGGPIGWQTFLPAALAYGLRYQEILVCGVCVCVCVCVCVVLVV